MLDWLDVTDLSFNALLLLEHIQLSWLPGWVAEAEFGIALRANPAVAWYARHKCPQIAEWVDGVLAQAPASATPEAIRAAEVYILRQLNDIILYVVEPARYDEQPFLGWDDAELTALVDFAGQTVIDVGAGAGRLAFVAAARGAEAVVAVEPVARLRRYILEKARARGLDNVFAVDGLLEAIQLPNALADVTLGGHVFGEYLEDEYAELMRVTRPGGMIILCPGNNDVDNAIHEFLVARGFQWARFEEPVDGMKRKYWKTR